MNVLLFPHLKMSGYICQSKCDAEVERLKGKTDFITCSKVYTIQTKLPTSNGFYCFFDKYGVVLYIGSSRNLQTRIKTSFIERRKQAPIKYIGFCTTLTEWEARIAEAVLIRKHRPILNKAYKFNAGLTSCVEFDSDTEIDVHQLEKYELVEKTQYDLLKDICNIRKQIQEGELDAEIQCL